METIQEQEYLDLTPKEQPTNDSDSVIDVGQFNLNLEQVNLDLGEFNINF